MPMIMDSVNKMKKESEERNTVIDGITVHIKGIGDFAFTIEQAKDLQRELNLFFKPEPLIVPTGTIIL